MFDAPDTTTSCARRDRSNSPLQALTLLNDPVFVESAQHWALHSNWQADCDWLTQAFRSYLSRQPSSAELSRLRDYYHDQLQTLAELSHEQVQAMCGAHFVRLSA